MKEITRLKLGLSQQQLAEWLFISRSQLANYERGNRSLPTRASTRLALLEILMHQMEQSKLIADREPDQPCITEHDSTAKEFMLREAIYFEMKANHLKKELRALQAKNAQTKDWQAVIRELQKDAPPGKYADIQQLWLQIQHDDTNERLKVFAPKTLLKLQVKIAVLEATARVYRESVNKN